MIKVLQRFLSTPKPTSNRLEPARRCVGVHRPFCSSEVFAGASLNALPYFAFVLSHFYAVSNICSRSPLPIASPRHWRRHFDFTAPAQLPESLGSGNYGSDWSLLLNLLQKTHLPSPAHAWLLRLSRGTCQQPQEGLGNISCLPQAPEKKRLCCILLRRATWLCSPLGSGMVTGQRDKVAAEMVLPKT